jgi:hypothetical protein
MALVLCSCTLINNMNPRHKEAQQHAQEIQQLQLTVMRFADEYVGRTRAAIDDFQVGLQDPEERLLTQSWKVGQAEAAYTIASGPNAVTNALDMVVLATLSRMVMDDTWVPEQFGPRAIPVQRTYQSVEADAWHLLDGVLSAGQVQRLHQVIDQWRAQHPKVRAVSYVHFRDFAGAVGAPAPGEEQTPGNLFAFIGIDPFSGLDPAVQEIAQTRQLAERTIYYMQRTPDLLDMQVLKLTYQIAVMPESRSVLDDAGRLSLVGSASDRLARTLPDLMDKEREALVKQLMQALNDQSATLGPLVEQLRAALQAGTDTANAVHGALQTAFQITSQFATPPGAPSQPPGPPFDIRQYTDMLRQATATAKEINTLADQADRLTPALRLATQDAAGRANQVLNHLFVLLVLLVFVVAAAVVLARLAYRRLAPAVERR